VSPTGAVAACAEDAKVSITPSFDRYAIARVYQSVPGMILFMNSSKRGTVKAVSPWFGLQIMPLMIKLARRGPKEFVGFLRIMAISPER
jgi:hypothetical protein